MKDRSALVIWEKNRLYRCADCETVANDYYLIGHHLIAAKHSGWARDASVTWALRVWWSSVVRRFCR